MILDELSLGQGGLGPASRLLLLLFLSHFLLPLLSLPLLLLLHSAPPLSAALFSPALSAPFTTTTRRQSGSSGRRRGRNPIPVPGGGKGQILLVLRQLTLGLEQLQIAAGNRADAIAAAVLSLVVVIGQLQLDVGLVFVGREAAVVILAGTGTGGRG
jgi:hypothetical protein